MIWLTLPIQLVDTKLRGKSPHPCSWSSNSNPPKPANQVLCIQLKITGRLIEIKGRTNLSVGRLISRNKDEDTCYRVLVFALGNRVGVYYFEVARSYHLLLVLEQNSS